LLIKELEPAYQEAAADRFKFAPVWAEVPKNTD
jgi:hypothetical protein